MRLVLIERDGRAIVKGVDKQLSRGDLRNLLQFNPKIHSDSVSSPFEKLFNDGGEAFVRNLRGSVLRFEKALLDNEAASPKHLLYERKLSLAQQLLPQGAIKPRLPLYLEGDPLVLGHTMEYIEGLQSFEDAAEGWNGNEATRALLSLHRFIERLHENKVLLGEVNWTNVGHDCNGNFVAFDTLSYDFPFFPCETAFPATVDPLLLIQDEGIGNQDIRMWARERPYSIDSDWFGFRCIVSQVLIGFQPWSGIHRNQGQCGQLRQPRVRALRRLSILDPNVDLSATGVYRYPEALNESLYEDLYRSFNQEVREPFPASLLENLRWALCPACGQEYSSSCCPCTVG